MKTQNCLNLFYILLALAIGSILTVATQERIRWTWWQGNTATYPVYMTPGGVQFGLRNDGVVVWREIMPAVTNSPAEQVEPWGTMTNVPMTNWLKPEWTNILIKPIYIPPWHHPEWTNWEEGARWWSNQVVPLN